MSAPTPEQVSEARLLLEDGCSYREAASTVGVGRGVLMRRLPGYGWSYRQAGSFRAAVRAAERAERKRGRA